MNATVTALRAFGVSLALGLAAPSFALARAAASSSAPAPSSTPGPEGVDAPRLPRRKRPSEAERAQRLEERRAKRRQKLEETLERLNEQVASLRRRAAAEGIAEEQKQLIAKELAQAESRIERTKERIERAEAGPLTEAQRRELLKKNRVQRQETRREQLKRRWGKLLEYPRVRGELEQHARRTARLLRVRSLASEAGDRTALGRCDELIKKEISRHNAMMRAMDRFAERQEAAATGRASSSLPTASESPSPAPPRPGPGSPSQP